MPTKNAHIILANRNQATIQHLLSDKDAHSEWITTIAFYKAVHMVEAVFATDRVHSHNHENRDHHLKTQPKYAKIYKYFRPLWAASMIARYLYDPETKTGYTTFSKYLTPDAVVSEMLRYNLRQLERATQDFL